jgi:hypothetical protein
MSISKADFLLLVDPIRRKSMNINYYNLTEQNIPVDQLPDGEADES